MGKVSEKGMDRKEPNSKITTKRDHPKDDGKDWRVRTNKNGSTIEETKLLRCHSHKVESPSDTIDNPNTSHLAASTSSPCLLTGCGNANTPTGASIEKHVHSHNIRIVSQSPPLSPIPVSPHPTLTDVPPFHHPPSPALPSDSDIPPDSVFLTPSQPRPQHMTQERPSSAPSDYLEKISGTLLRLVGDHYLCSTCGRQLRTIGDQLTMETNINHIRRAISATHLERNQIED